MHRIVNQPQGQKYFTFNDSHLNSHLKSAPYLSKVFRVTNINLVIPSP